jgi:hypothetical protein
MLLCLGLLAAALPVAAAETGSSTTAEAAPAETADQQTDDALAQMEQMELLALSVAEGHAVVRSDGALHLLARGDALPGIPASSVRLIQSDQLVVLLPGGVTARWFSANASGGARIVALRSTAPADPTQTMSLPYFIPLRHVESADAAESRPDQP